MRGRTFQNTFPHAAVCASPPDTLYTAEGLWDSWTDFPTIHCYKTLLGSTVSVAAHTQLTCSYAEKQASVQTPLKLLTVTGSNGCHDQGPECTAFPTNSWLTELLTILSTGKDQILTAPSLLITSETGFFQKIISRLPAKDILKVDSVYLSYHE